MGIKTHYLNDKNGKFYPHAHADATYDRNGNKVGDILEQILLDIEDLKYVAITIDSFTNTVGNVENGIVITDVTLNWDLNKIPTTLSLNGETLDKKSTSKTFTDLNLSSGTTTWTLKATDSKGTIASKSTSISFMNRIYYGVSKEPTEYDDGFIINLSNNPLSNSKSRTITVTASDEQYIYYCVPSRLGNCNFNFNGFDGGFQKVTTFNFTNIYGYIESYDVWKSDNKNLGTITIKVS